jgi:hypothetical protein
MSLRNSGQLNQLVKCSDAATRWNAAPAPLGGAPKLSRDPKDILMTQVYARVHTGSVPG